MLVTIGVLVVEHVISEKEFSMVIERGRYGRIPAKNFMGPEHDKHAVRLCGYNRCYSTMQRWRGHENGWVSGVMECLHIEKHKKQW